MDIEAAFNQLVAQTNKIAQSSTSIEDAFTELLKTYSEDLEDTPKTQPSQAIAFSEPVEAIAFSEPVEGVNSQDPESLIESETSDSYGFTFIAEDQLEEEEDEEEENEEDSDEISELNFDYD
jgi:hypothetical protein